ncbi:hypothetical protein [Rhodococcus sp. Leaf233]|uniref:hypothetical protein n=1 Tax=Rhodococcus sp. Leaf233 TaxID=1736302 RepID=UPI0007101538|nr:hypothetical protein [Rhodococcus sp. Leaf233]KQU33544.1 hypothetical protein ASH04_06835 [Rhodococcus sp. Leaf233]
MTAATERKVVTLTIVDPVHPGRPPLTMNQWRNAHWAVKTAAKERLYWQVVSALQTAGVKRGAVPNFERIKVSIVQYAPDMRVRDNDGLGAFRKDILDAMKRRNVVRDDSRLFVKDGGNEIETDRKLPRMEILIEELS